MIESNWKKNERVAAARLGLAVTDDNVKARDIESLAEGSERIATALTSIADALADVAHAIRARTCPRANAREGDKVRVLDTDLDDGGGRVVLAILKHGGLSIQSFHESSRGRPVWRLRGRCTLAPDVVREWAESLQAAGC